jgi:hypothetical protein
MSDETTKLEILEKIKEGPVYTLYCCACGEVLCKSKYFRMYIVHFDCKDKDMIYYNVRPDRPIQ